MKKSRNRTNRLKSKLDHTRSGFVATPGQTNSNIQDLIILKNDNSLESIDDDETCDPYLLAQLQLWVEMMDEVLKRRKMEYEILLRYRRPFWY